MSLERIKTAADQAVSRYEIAKGRGEEATKQALVLPLLAAMGYDIWNPAEVLPEYEADFAIKKGGQKEKVDYAIFENGAPKIFIEVKSCDCPLDGHQGQLARYFNAIMSVQLAIITNGIEWRFYADTRNSNVLDPIPFHISKLDATDQGLEVFSRFAKNEINKTQIGDYASDLLYTAKITAFLRRMLDLKSNEDAGEPFIRWILASQDTEGDDIYPGVVNKNVVNRFQPIVKAALFKVLREVIRRSISAMDKEMSRGEDETDGQSASSEDSTIICMDDSTEDGAEEAMNTESKRAIITTDEELALFANIEQLFRDSSHKGQGVYEPSMKKMVDVRIGYKDTTAYFGIFINKPSWWIMRAMLDGRRKWIAFDLPRAKAEQLLPDGYSLMPPSTWGESRVQIESENAIFDLRPLFEGALGNEIMKHQDPDEVSAVEVEATR